MDYNINQSGRQDYGASPLTQLDNISSVQPQNQGQAGYPQSYPQVEYQSVDQYSPVQDQSKTTQTGAIGINQLGQDLTGPQLNQQYIQDTDATNSGSGTRAVFLGVALSVVLVVIVGGLLYVFV